MVRVSEVLGGSCYEFAKEKVSVFPMYSYVFLIACQKQATDTTISSINQKEQNHTVQSSSQENQYDAVLDGDLSLFVGKFSSDEFNQTIVDSGFMYGGYTPEDYYNNRTSIFPALTNTGYWNGGASHGSFEVDPSDLPQKISDYYKVTVHGVNGGANGASLIFYLVPPNVEGPTGVVNSERTVFQEVESGYRQLEYQRENWWENYEQTTVTDLDIEAINSGDFTTLAGTWENGRGEILTIYGDGSTDRKGYVRAVPDSDKNSKIPYVSFNGIAIGLLKIGFSNPEGDQSDVSQPRLVVTQQAGNYDASFYYYRK